MRGPSAPESPIVIFAIPDSLAAVTGGPCADLVGGSPSAQVSLRPLWEGEPLAALTSARSWALRRLLKADRGAIIDSGAWPARLAYSPLWSVAFNESHEHLGARVRVPGS